jgi:saccharopine dehydrogenase (NAD+, L-lysine-forming)
MRILLTYGLGEEFIGVLRTLHKLGLDATEPVRVGAASVAPRDVVAACLPDPGALGDRMSGLTCAGTWVTGTAKDSAPREVYLYHVVDNAWSMAGYGSQAVVWQTAVNPVVALALIDSGAWSGAGVRRTFPGLSSAEARDLAPSVRSGRRSAGGSWWCWRPARPAGTAAP